MTSCDAKHASHAALARQRELHWSLEKWQQSAGVTGGDLIVSERVHCFLRIFIGDVIDVWIGDAKRRAA